MEMTDIQVVKNVEVSVPIRGLFNLTHLKMVLPVKFMQIGFRPHQGII